jgi:hypothetical protein
VLDLDLQPSLAPFPHTSPLQHTTDLLLRTLILSVQRFSQPYMMACFFDLPAELQIQIFDYLHAADVKSARAVSRKFRDNATPALLRSIVACARYQALGAFQNVSLHSIYAGYVKEVIFDGTIYDAQLACIDRAHYAAEDKFESLEFYRHWARRTRCVSLTPKEIAGYRTVNIFAAKKRSKVWRTQIKLLP